MELNNYDSLMNLDVASYDWSCRVRAQAVWKAMNRETQEFWGLNILFIDDSNHRIHAYANAKYCESFKEGLVEGHVYIVTNFKVKHFLGDETYRPVRNDKHIFFTKDTKLTKDGEGGLQIEKYAFDLFDMTQLVKLAKDNRFLVDMVGVVKNKRPIAHSVKDNVDKYRLKFDLVDGRHSVKVTFFDEFAVLSDKALDEANTEHVIVIIACARVTTYEGQPQLTNYPATRLYIQPEHYCVDLLQKKLNQMFEISSDEDEVQKNVMTIADIKQLKQIQEEVSCEIRVEKFEKKKNWYLISCSNCTNELQMEQSSLKCSNCKRTIPFPRRSFNLKAICSDASGSFKVLFPDMEVCRLIQKTVDDLYCPEKEAIGEQPFPDILKQFIKQKYILTILIKDENLNNNDSVYEATQIDQPIESFANFSPSQEQNLNQQEMSITKDLKTCSTSTVTPETEKSTNNKTKGRKVEQHIPFNIPGKKDKTQSKKKTK